MSQTKPTIEITPLKKRLEADHQQIIDALIRIKSPSDTAGINRPKLNISIVIDRSGSMGGDKMSQAIEATKTCIDNLIPTDRIGCVSFDDTVEVLFPNQPVQDKAGLRRKVEDLFPRGSTALHSAWVKGGLEVTNHYKENAINRVILVTDGEANVGLRDPRIISQQARELNDKGVSTTTIGIGHQFNEDLLIPMAEGGGGNSWHVRQASDMDRIFGVELNGLVAQFGHSVTMDIRPGDGVEILDVLNDFEKTPDGRMKLPNLTATNDIDVIVRLRVSGKHEGIVSDLLETDISFVGQESGIAERVADGCKVEFVSPEVAATEVENGEVANTALLLSNARDRKKAMENIDRGDFASAMSVMKDMRMNLALQASHSPSAALISELDGVDEELQQLLSRQYGQVRKSMAFRGHSRPRGKFDLGK